MYALSLETLALYGFRPLQANRILKSVNLALNVYTPNEGGVRPRLSLAAHPLQTCSAWWSRCRGPCPRPCRW